MCNTIARNLGVVPSSDIQEWSPLDTGTNPAIPPKDPFDDLQDIGDPSLTADLGFLTASNQGLDKSLVNDPRLPEEDLTDIFTGAPFTSATILNDNFINNIDLDPSEPSEFRYEGIGGCLDEVSSFYLLALLPAQPSAPYFALTIFPPFISILSGSESGRNDAGEDIDTILSTI